MAVTPVSHPGPRPSEFTYPFEEARAALDAIDELMDELAGCASDHEAATVEACVGFEGSSRRAFERWMGDALQAVGHHQRQLDGDADELRAQLALADQRRRDREEAIRRWDRQLASYHDYQRELAELERSGLRGRRAGPPAGVGDTCQGFLASITRLGEEDHPMYRNSHRQWSRR